MFAGYEDREAYEDEIYCEDSSSELSIDSDVEFHLYSQVHYAPKVGNAGGQEGSKAEIRKGQKKTKAREEEYILISDSDTVQPLASPDIIILTDTADEESVYTCKRKKTHLSELLEKQAKPLTSDTSAEESSTKRRDRVKKFECASGASLKKGSSQAREAVIVVESSAEEEENCASSESEESDCVENWMILGRGKEEEDNDILLNLEGCGSSDTEG
uniref:Zinc finger CCHC-type containing 7 n=1 Tax=Latimeria chalumnae TaxID=7897 RepID=H3AXI1_LATCH